MKETELLTPKQLAERWQVSEATLNLWRHQGKGAPYVKLGSLVRYRLSAVQKFEGMLKGAKKLSEI